MKKFSSNYEQERAVQKQREEAAARRLHEETQQRWQDAQKFSSSNTGSHTDWAKMARQDEELDQWRSKQELKKQQERQQEIDEIKESGLDGITAAAYYATAVDHYNGTHGHSVNKPLAAQTFWQALVLAKGVNQFFCVSAKIYAPINPV